ncbi:hypothetical protein H6P81_015209 [Aristolochia fimbriata]|uniref:Uncharacterized protein n=1 Tax=Aristolochia fimbriata TaxID=158543 RepID=A0AAV7E4Z5_ARIFI|nr:hypothetical protein H6P81_015209 [Aristolochia fimbriata]
MEKLEAQIIETVNVKSGSGTEYSDDPKSHLNRAMEEGTRQIQIVIYVCIDTVLMEGNKWKNRRSCANGERAAPATESTVERRIAAALGEGASLITDLNGREEHYRVRENAQTTKLCRKGRNSQELESERRVFIPSSDKVQ